MDGLELRMNLALQAPRIAEMDGASLLKFCSGLISQCYVMVGYQTYNERDIAILSAKLSSDLLESYSYFTKEEVMDTYLCEVAVFDFLPLLPADFATTK